MKLPTQLILKIYCHSANWSAVNILWSICKMTRVFKKTNDKQPQYNSSCCITFGSRRIQNFLVDFCLVLQLAHMYNSVSSNSSTSMKLDKQSANTTTVCAREIFSYRASTNDYIMFTIKHSTGRKLQRLPCSRNDMELTNSIIMSW